jgi:N,N'-diacetyllegionaminate synthase
MSVKIIAEIGVNHNADIDLAYHMISEAAKSGADIIKFQTAIPELVQTKDAKMADYQIKNTGTEISQLNMAKKIHFPIEKFSLLKDKVESYNKVFMSTAFDLKSLDFLHSLGESQYKIPSGELTNLPYLRAVGLIARDVIVSTGMATWQEVKDAIQVFLDCGISRHNIVVLQCNTEYPTPFKDVNLNSMVWMGEQLSVKYGYSDHTIGIEAAIAAVALGAVVIEKHFTTDKNLPGPDQKVSLEPAEFASMVNGIRNIEEALGKYKKSPTESELKNKIIARRGLYASKNLNCGAIIGINDLVALRPEQKFSPMNIDELIGKKLKRSLLESQPILLDDVE